MENKFHNTLNKKLWQDKELKPEVSKKLMDIANAFIEFLDVPKEAIKDIVITGSSASYNYTPYSDIDLHLLVDFDKVHKDCPIVGDFLISKKSEFNSNHDIFIYGIPVEVYAESINNENVHNGLYSIKDNKWIDEPKKLKPVENDVAVAAKYKEFKEAVKNVKDGDTAKELIDKIKKMRKSGLEKEGEFSVENLVFKKLRNEGVIGKLMNIRKEGIDKELSLEEAYEGIINAIEEMINTSTAVMSPYATPVVGQFNPSKYEKQGKKREKKAVLGYKYKKLRSNSLLEDMQEIAELSEAIKGIVSEGREEGEAQEQFKNRLHGELLSKVRDELATQKAISRDAYKRRIKADKEWQKSVKNVNGEEIVTNPEKAHKAGREFSKQAGRECEASQKVSNLSMKRAKLQKM